MRWLNILSFPLCFAAAPALALMPVAQLNKPGCHSIKTSQEEEFRKLLQEVNVGENDGRDAISMFTRDISVRDQLNLARISGDIVCTIDGQVLQANARLIEDGGQIITNAHVFVGKNKKIDKKRLPSCTFTSKSNPSHPIPVVLREGSYFFGSDSPLSDHLNDVALARLGETVRDVEIPKFGKPAEIGETVILVTTSADFSKKQIDSNQLVAQICDVNRSGPAKPGQGSYFFSECSSVPGDSAGVYYINRGGEFQAVGIHEGGGDVAMNGAPYDINHPDPKKRSFSLGLGFDERILQESRDLAIRGTNQADAKGDRKVNSVPGRPASG